MPDKAKYSPQTEDPVKKKRNQVPRIAGTVDVWSALIIEFKKYTNERFLDQKHQLRVFSKRSAKTSDWQFVQTLFSYKKMQLWTKALSSFWQTPKGKTRM